LDGSWRALPCLGKGHTMEEYEIAQEKDHRT
jgi:hypothetical protein